jgi:hypothetical protein
MTDWFTEARRRLAECKGCAERRRIMREMWARKVAMVAARREAIAAAQKSGDTAALHRALNIGREQS